MNISTSPGSRLRVALFSGNYDYVRDGANQALNRWVDFLEHSGAVVRVYSPTGDKPAFPHSGTLISVPSVPIPRRREYRVALGLPNSIKQDVLNFAPNIVHLSAPDLLGYGALRLARKRRIPVVASVHTRFETYFRYYGLSWLEKHITSYLRHFYGQCAEIYAPTLDMGEILKTQGMSKNVQLWSRGVDGHRFSPDKRSAAWREALGFKPSDVVVLFVGRLVLEKGLQAFADAIARLEEKQVSCCVLVVGDGPARQWFQDRLPGAVFTGFLEGDDLAQAYASSDIFFNPSMTETFGNVTLEAMASGLPSVCAAATGSRSLISHNVNGLLTNDHDEFAQALEDIIVKQDLRLALGVAARATSQSYVWDQVMRNLQGHFLEVVRSFSVEPVSRLNGLPHHLSTFSDVEAH